MRERILAYFETLDRVLHAIVATDADGRDLPLDAGIEWAIDASTDAHRNGNKVMFIGNGGSASIASHMAIDYSKNGNIRSLAFNDGAALTCLGNDLGYENVFAKQLDMHARPGDLLMAISSSGRSRNILNSVEVARKRGCKIVTLSGFSGDNPLRQGGNVNFYVASGEYGFVEISHLVLCHSILDLAMGWKADAGGAQATVDAAE